MRHVTDDDDIDDAQLHIEIKVEAPLLRISIVNKGLPFDPSDIPEYDATQIELMISAEGDKSKTTDDQADAFDSELALFLLKQAVDRYQIHNAGKEGIFFELEWFLPDKHISEEVEQEAVLKDHLGDTDFSREAAKDAKSQLEGVAPSAPHRAMHDGSRQLEGECPHEPHRATHDGSGQEVGQGSPSTPHRATHDDSAPVADPREEKICVLAERDALGISQLIYRSYGDTYPHEDFYFPARLRAHQSSGRIKSWGVTTSGSKVVGHLALQKSHPDALAVEWGAVVVDPQWRSAGLMKKMLTAAIAEMEERPEMVFFVHAVTTHPFTQKTCNRFGFVPTALLFGFASDNLRFRGLQEQAVQRESMFFAARLLRPLPPQKLYPPKHHYETLERLFASLGLSLDELTTLPVPQSEASDNPEEQSLISTTIISSINIGTIDVTKTGADFATLLSRELRRLCRERVDMIYLNIDLADPLGGSCKTSFF
jgi:RimJ/RimL family protein N-acetyltransferase